MLKVGIDTLAVYTSRYALDLAVLAQARNVDPDKFHVGLGQRTMSVPPPGEDIVTMAANAGLQALRGCDLNDIEMLLFATESGIDQSKAAGLFVHSLLGLPARCRVIELKQACYAGTAGIQLALPFLRENPYKKVLVIASDIARYGLGTTGESSQGSGAAAMVLSANPRILAIEPESGIAAEDVMDFWRPNYSHEAFVDGKYSSRLYLQMLEKSWQEYKALSGRQFADHAYFCYHTPVPRLVEKAHQHLLKVNEVKDLPEDAAAKQINAALEYGRRLGNSYTASLYVSLASLLDTTTEDLSGKRIGFYSYGSGCVAEYFSGVVQPDYQAAISRDYHADLFATRKPLTYEEYAEFYQFQYQEDGSEQEIPVYQTGAFRLAKLQNHKRLYEKIQQQKVEPHHSSLHLQRPAPEEREQLRLISSNTNLIKVYAPGKLILSGEHAVVHGQPALAMAVNRFVTATVTRETASQVAFDLSDLAHSSHLSVDALHHLKEKIKQKYYRFIRGDYSIREVLQKPFELAQFAMGLLAEAMNLTLPHGVKIHVQSDIPMGCGMGSSAATIVSVMQAMANFLELPMPREKLFQLAMEAENMQHGRSSGLDLRIALQGGCIYMQGNEIQERSIPALPMYLVNTGAPQSTTGQCVEKAAPHFKSSALGEDFAAVTNAMDAALRQQSWRDMHTAVRANHKLLTKIGVVPERVQNFISQIEAAGGAAKICGAGSVAGDHAGAVLVTSEDRHQLMSLCSRFAYQVIPVSGELRGVHAA